MPSEPASDWRRSVLGRIAIAAESGSVIVGPDHPFLWPGPDALVARNEGLLALFVPLYREQAHSEELRARLVLARLALPSSATFVLLIDDEPSAIGDSLINDFDLVERASSVERVVVQRFGERRVGPVPPEVRAAVSRRFATAATSSLRSLEKANTLGGPSLTPKQGGDIPMLRRGSRPNGRIVRHQTTLMLDATTLRNRVQLTRWLRRGILASIETDFNVDDGVPFMRGRGLPIHVATAPVLEAQRSPDPEKMFRAAAFAGWRIEFQPYDYALS